MQSVIMFSSVGSTQPCYHLFIHRFNFSKLALEDEADDKSQEGLNKAGKGGLIYGEYLHVSMRQW